VAKVDKEDRIFAATDVPTDGAANSVAIFRTDAPVPTLVAPRAALLAELAIGALTTEKTPAVNTDTAITAMRDLVVFLNICFLSLVTGATVVN
jgi:hypothetical protein